MKKSIETYLQVPSPPNLPVKFSREPLYWPFCTGEQVTGKGPIQGMGKICVNFVKNDSLEGIYFLRRLFEVIQAFKY